MTQTLETLQSERENLARQIKELDRQIKFVQNNVPKYDINHPDSPIHALKKECTDLGCHLKVRQTSKGIIKLELTGNHKDILDNQVHYITFTYQTPEPVTTNEGIEDLCWKFSQQLYRFKAIDNVFYSAHRDHKPEIIKLTSLDQTSDFVCDVQYGGLTIPTTFKLSPVVHYGKNSGFGIRKPESRVSCIVFEKILYNNRITRNRETTYPIDAQGYTFRIHVSQKDEPKTTVFHNIRLTKTIYGTKDEPITRNRLCHELKLFVRKYNLVTNDPPTVKILP